MKVQQLPNDFLTDNDQAIQLYDYSISSACLKNKIVLTKNVFSFLVEGSKELITHDQTVTIKTDKFLLIKAGNCLMSENLSPSNNYRSMLMFFSDEALLSFFSKYQINITRPQNTTPYEVCNYDHFCTHFVDTLKQIKTYEHKLQKQLLQPKFEEIMLYLIHKKGSAFIENFIVQQSDFTKNFKGVIENNRLSTLSVPELAFLCNMSISTFKREFEKNYQTSPIKWFQAKRLEHSAYLLSTKKIRPIELYDKIGYESLSSFTQAFKQKFGTTPKQFQVQKMNF